MKNILLATSFFFTLLFISCKKQECQNIPGCIADKIAALKSKPTQNPAAVVIECTYRNKKMYYISSGCCDQFNYLYDSECNAVCAPDGGLTGKGDNSCGDFYQSSTNKKIIWQDPR